MMGKFHHALRMSLVMLSLPCLAMTARAQMQAPKSGAEWAQAQTTFALQTGDKVWFNKDEAFLNSGAFAALEKQAAWLKANPAISVVIEGHADKAETNPDKRQLGEIRALAAAAYLQHLGIGVERLNTGTFGADRPLQLCEEETCVKDNRRVQTTIAR